MTKKLIGVLIAASVVSAVALPALAQNSAVTPARTTVKKTVNAAGLPSETRGPKTTVKKTVNVACIQGAIETRDSAVISAVSAHANDQTAALSTRKSALKSAWAITDQKARRAALREGWTAFSKATKAGRKAFRDAQNAAWRQFNADRKACGTGVSDDPGNQGRDSQL